MKFDYLNVSVTANIYVIAFLLTDLYLLNMGIEVTIRNKRFSMMCAVNGGSLIMSHSCNLVAKRNTLSMGDPFFSPWCLLIKNKYIITYFKIHANITKLTRINEGHAVSTGQASNHDVKQD